MALSNPPSAQELSHRISLSKRLDTDDGLGNTKGKFQEQFRLWAAFRSRGGSEAVVAARLEGRNTIGVYVRSSPQARTIDSTWRMTDVRSGESYAVKIVDSVTDRAWVYLEAQTGVAP